jgi:hypothetical protein
MRRLQLNDFWHFPVMVLGYHGDYCYNRELFITEVENNNVIGYGFDVEDGRGYYIDVRYDKRFKKLYL